MSGWLIEPRSTTEKAKTALDVELDMVVNGVEPMSAYLLQFHQILAECNDQATPELLEVISAILEVSMQLDSLQNVNVPFVVYQTFTDSQWIESMISVHANIDDSDDLHNFEQVFLLLLNWLGNTAGIGVFDAQLILSFAHVCENQMRMQLYLMLYQSHCISDPESLNIFRDAMNIYDASYISSGHATVSELESATALIVYLLDNIIDDIRTAMTVEEIFYVFTLFLNSKCHWVGGFTNAIIKQICRHQYQDIAEVLLPGILQQDGSTIPDTVSRLFSTAARHLVQSFAHSIPNETFAIIYRWIVSFPNPVELPFHVKKDFDAILKCLRHTVGQTRDDICSAIDDARSSLGICDESSESDESMHSAFHAIIVEARESH